MDYHATLALDAPIDRVYEALTTADGLTSWWGRDGEIDTATGGHIRFNWSATSYVVFRIDRLSRPTEIDWTCIDQHDANLPHPDEWVGTQPKFRLSRDDGVTQLDFVHRGLQPQLACYETCEVGWENFLDHSLRSLVETGRGAPYVSRAA